MRYESIKNKQIQTRLIRGSIQWLYMPTDELRKR